MVDYSKWYTQRFGAIHPDWYVFPFGKPKPTDPTRPMVTLKTSWNNARKKANVQGRWHDNRHTLVTDLAESGAGDETIRDIAGHVSKQMLKHYSHIRMEAKRRALEAILTKPDLKVTANALSVPEEPAVQAAGVSCAHKEPNHQLTAAALALGPLHQTGNPRAAALNSASSLRLPWT